MDENQKREIKENVQKVVEKVSTEFKNHRKMAALSYFWALCLIPLLGSKDEFVKFHAKQGFVLFIFELVLSLVGWIPIIGWLASVAVVLIAIIGVIKALNGKKWKIPYVYGWSKKIKI